MRIAVFGTGAVGGYFGGRLAEAGEDVVFIARGRQLTALREHVDLILVGTKAWQVAEAALAMRPLVGSHTTVLPLQNGVEAPDQLAAVLGRGPVVGGLCRIMSFLAEPGVIRHVGAEPVLTFGELDGHETERCRSLLAVLGSAGGMRAELVPDVQVELWRKLQMMAATSAVGTAARMPFGVLLELPETRRLLKACMDEVRSVAVARGVELPKEEADRTMAFLDRLPADGVTSLYRDLDAGRPSELEAQLGAVVRLGAEVGVDTPVCATLYAALLPSELAARGEPRVTD
jgi:2-dehydropantoate 2-reductase